MATVVATASGTWKAVIRKRGWPVVIKTFRLKRDAEDWARRTEDEIVRGVHIQRAPSERITVEAALDRYLKEVTPTKELSTQYTDRGRAKTLKKFFGRYSLAAVTPELAAQFRDQRLSGDIDAKTGTRKPRAANTVRVDLALLSHLFTVAIQEWGLGLTYNPVLNIRKPSPGPGRNRRLSAAEEARLISKVDQHSNPMLKWIVRIAIETGMRSSEVTSLHRNQVDLNRRIARLEKTKNGDARTVPLTKQAAAAFEAAMNNPIRPIDTDLIFFGEPGRDKKRRPYNFNKVWMGIKESVGPFKISTFMT